MKRELSYDVVVAGGGSAGAAAAMGAAQAGSKTLLLDRNACLGGESTGACVAAYCGFHSRGNPPTQVVAGAGERVLRKLRELGEPTDYVVSPATGNSSIKFDPEMLKLALDLALAESGASCLLHLTVTGAEVRGGKLLALECVDDEGPLLIRGKAFVDATGDGNLAALCGCGTRWGDQNGVTQLASLVTRIDHIPPDVDLTPDAMERAIRAAKAAGARHLAKERGFLIRRGDADFGFLTTPSVQVDSLSAEALTAAEQNLRLQAHAYVKALRDHLPGMEHCRLVSTGPQMGLRETRRIDGETVLTMEDVVSCRKRPREVVARGGWSPEVHRGTGVSYTHLSDGSWFDIPVGSVKARDVGNLWMGGRCVSCDQTAHASVRVMGTAFATGHAAGVGAALSLQGGGLGAIQTELRRQDALL